MACQTCRVPHLCKVGHFAKECLSEGEGADIRCKGAAKSNSKHLRKSHKERKQHKNCKCYGKKKFHEVHKESDSDRGSSSSNDYENANIDELTFVIDPINVDMLHRGSEVYVDLETVKTHIPFSSKVDTGAQANIMPHRVYTKLFAMKKEGSTIILGLQSPKEFSLISFEKDIKAVDGIVHTQLAPGNIDMQLRCKS